MRQMTIHAMASHRSRISLLGWPRDGVLGRTAAARNMQRWLCLSLLASSHVAAFDSWTSRSTSPNPDAPADAEECRWNCTYGCDDQSAGAGCSIDTRVDLVSRARCVEFCDLQYNLMRLESRGSPHSTTEPGTIAPVSEESFSVSEAESGAISEEQLSAMTNNSPHCQSWATVGECLANPKFMRAVCERACALREDARCAAWARRNECSNNPAFMEESCPIHCAWARLDVAYWSEAFAAGHVRFDESDDFPGGHSSGSDTGDEGALPGPEDDGGGGGDVPMLRG